MATPENENQVVVENENQAVVENNKQDSKDNLTNENSKQNAKLEKSKKEKDKAKKDKAKKPREHKVSKAKETVSELKKVSWPSFGKVVKQTLVVLGMVIFFTVVLFAIDQLLGLGYNQIVELLKNNAG